MPPEGEHAGAADLQVLGEDVGRVDEQVRPTLVPPVRWSSPNSMSSCLVVRHVK